MFDTTTINYYVERKKIATPPTLTTAGCSDNLTERIAVNDTLGVRAATIQRQVSPTVKFGRTLGVEIVSFWGLHSSPCIPVCSWSEQSWKVPGLICRLRNNFHPIKIQPDLRKLNNFFEYSPGLYLFLVFIVPYFVLIPPVFRGSQPHSKRGSSLRLITFHNPDLDIMAGDANNQCAAMEELGLPKALVTTLIEDEGAVVLTALQTAICTEGRAGADLLVQVGADAKNCTGKTEYPMLYGNTPPKRVKKHHVVFDTTPPCACFCLAAVGLFCPSCALSLSYSMVCSPIFLYVDENSRSVYLLGLCVGEKI